jgi:alkylation response protein AidB-like acyl-CoA dehydrogenase
MEKNMTEIENSFGEFVDNIGPTMTLPGLGDTWRRFAVLAEAASIDLSLGRLCEGHADALAIIAESGNVPSPGASYGVWASRSRSANTFAHRVNGGWSLSGSKEFCSGARIIDRALVTAASDEGYLLFDIDVAEQVTCVIEDSWPAIGMADSQSETLEFGGVAIPESALVGPPEFYVQRPGFWFGAAGVAACWFGGAVGLLNGVMRWMQDEPSESVLVDLGGAVSELEAMRYALQAAARDFDKDPNDRRRQAKFRALVTRRVVHDAALAVLERVASAGGARPLCHDSQQARRAADLYVYLSQHRGNADAKELGGMLTKAQSWI